MKELLNRLTSPTPDFFVKVRNVAIGLVTAATVVVSISSVVAIPAAVLTVSSYVIAIGTAVGITAQTTKKDTPQTPAK